MTNAIGALREAREDYLNFRFYPQFWVRNNNDQPFGGDSSNGKFQNEKNRK